MPAKVPFRVVVTYEGVPRKFFSIFQGRDGSLYIHLNRPDGQPWRIPGGGDGKEEPKRLTLDFVDFREPGFKLHKITFHPSGYIHLTNKEGVRHRGGTRGPAFAEMSSPYDLCVLVPCRPEQLPIFAKDRSIVVNLALPEEIGPFYATLSLIKSSASLPQAAGPLLVPMLVLPLEASLSLALTIRPVLDAAGEGTTSWPPFPFFLLRIAA
jgi:hypothetical protein